MNYWPHQARVIKENPKRAILAHEMRTGKSLIGAAWIDNPTQGNNTYIITPKQNRDDWKKMGTRAKVLTKEEFKKYRPMMIKPTAIVVDEAHYFACALFTRKRSQLAEALYSLVKENPDMHVLLLTATPIRQDAWSLHTLLCYIGVYYDWEQWRKDFFELTRLPFLAWPIYVPRPDWRIKIRSYLEKHCDIVSLKDIVENLPERTTEVIKVKSTPYKRPEDEVVNWMHEHQHEQIAKASVIADLGYKKLLIACHYTAQIDSLAEKLGKEKPVFILDGRTKDAAAVKKAAQEAEECYFIVQASMLFAFDGYMFGALVFASMSHSCVHHTQALGRQRHLEHLQPVTTIYYIGGRWDKRIFDTVMSGRDFDPHFYLHESA